jgi:hypothetical protein
LQGLAFTAAKTKLASLQAGLATATGVLNAAKAIVKGPGYAAAQASIDAYTQGVNDAKRNAEASINLANMTLQSTITTQNALVTQAEAALKNVQTSSNELHTLQLAQATLSNFQDAEAKTIAGLQNAVNGLARSSEAITFNAANAGLAVAKTNTNDVAVARSALQYADTATEAVLDVGQWVTNHEGNILNIRSVDVTGDLRGLCAQGSVLKAHIVGTFAEQNVDFNCDFIPKSGGGEEFVKRVFKILLDDMKEGLLKIAK